MSNSTARYFRGKKKEREQRQAKRLECGKISKGRMALMLKNDLERGRMRKRMKFLPGN